MKKVLSLLSVLLLVFSLSACALVPIEEAEYIASVNDVPEFSGETPFVLIRGNVPSFTEDEKSAGEFETYSALDYLGRCGTAFAMISENTMPTEERGSIGQVKPSGWHTVKYDIVDGKYLYNRCHLIGYQLAAENANEQNLITGTRYMNVEGMLPFENEVAEYVKKTGKRVLYRVTPVFDGDNLLARGVQMEALSVNDGGKGVCFNVYVYNVQPGVIIDYKTGESALLDAPDTEIESGFVVNISSKKFHKPSCKNAATISDKNRKIYSGSRDSLINNGYSPCGACNP